MALRKWVEMEKPDSYSEGTLEPATRRDKCINVDGNYNEKNYISVE